MTVIFSKKCEYGMQAILYLAAQDKGTLVSAEDISKVLKIRVSSYPKFFKA